MQERPLANQDHSEPVPEGFRSSSSSYCLTLPVVIDQHQQGDNRSNCYYSFNSIDSERRYIFNYAEMDIRYGPFFLSEVAKCVNDPKQFAQ